MTIALLIATVAMGGAQAHLALAENVIDLGEFEETELQTREIYIKNTGDKPLVIMKAFTSCTCTRVGYSHSPVAPGDSIPLSIIFDGRKRKPGSVKKVIRLTSNADNGVVNLLVKGDIVRPFQK